MPIEERLEFVITHLYEMISNNNSSREVNTDKEKDRLKYLSYPLLLLIIGTGLSLMGQVCLQIKKMNEEFEHKKILADADFKHDMAMMNAEFKYKMAGEKYALMKDYSSNAISHFNAETDQKRNKYYGKMTENLQRIYVLYETPLVKCEAYKMEFALEDKPETRILEKPDFDECKPIDDTIHGDDIEKQKLSIKLIEAMKNEISEVKDMPVK